MSHDIHSVCRMTVYVNWCGGNSSQLLLSSAPVSAECSLDHNACRLPIHQERELLPCTTATYMALQQQHHNICTTLTVSQPTVAHKTAITTRAAAVALQQQHHNTCTTLTVSQPTVAHKAAITTRAAAVALQQQHHNICTTLTVSQPTVAHKTVITTHAAAHAVQTNLY